MSNLKKKNYAEINYLHIYTSRPSSLANGLHLLQSYNSLSGAPSQPWHFLTHFSLTFGSRESFESPLSTVLQSLHAFVGLLCRHLQWQGGALAYEEDCGGNSRPEQQPPHVLV